MTEQSDIIAELGLCGCGDPEIVIKLLMAFMKQKKALLDKIHACKQHSFNCLYCNIHYKSFDKKINRLLSSKFTKDALEYLVWYVLDDKEFMEHGTSVPGWLTGKGERLLENRKQILESLKEPN